MTGALTVICQGIRGGRCHCGVVLLDIMKLGPINVLIIPCHPGSSPESGHWSGTAWVYDCSRYRRLVVKLEMSLATGI